MKINLTYVIAICVAQSFLISKIIRQSQFSFVPVPWVNYLLFSSYYPTDAILRVYEIRWPLTKCVPKSRNERYDSVVSLVVSYQIARNPL